MRAFSFTNRMALALYEFNRYTVQANKTLKSMDTAKWGERTVRFSKTNFNKMYPLAEFNDNFHRNTNLMHPSDHLHHFRLQIRRNSFKRERGKT